MKIFVIGQSGTGKTPFAKLVGEQLGMKAISASEWLNKLSDGKRMNTKQEHIDVLTEITLRELRENQDACGDFIRANHDLTQPLIIEGCRNPRDFVQLFDPMHDVVIFLNRESNPYHTTPFEMGILVIDSYVNWTAGIGLLDKEKRVCYAYKIDELPKVIDNFVKFFKYKDWCVICGDSGCKHQRSSS